MPNSLNNALNNIDLSSLGMSMNGAPSGGQRLNFNINTLINPNPSVPVGAMTASQHAVKTGVDEKGNDIINAATPGQITSQYNIQQANKNVKSAFKAFNDQKSATGGFMNSKAGKFGGQYGGVIGDTASAIGDMIGKRGLNGKYGGITKGMDTTYDTIQKAAANFGPIGNIVSGAMGVGKLVGNAVSKIGGGTDGITKTDAILNSAFLNLTPLGLINGFGGKKANTYTRNAELDKSTNGGFQGFLTTQDVTQIGAGKKYGLFSSGARNKQNQLTEFTSNMKHTISGIVDTNTINNLAAQGSTPFVANQQSIDLSGGIQQMRAARHGMQFSRRVVSKYAIGNKLKRSIQTIDVATGKYVEVPTDLTKEQIQGKVPIRLANGTTVFMNKDGTVSSERWETVGEREHLTPKGQEGMKVEEFKQGGQMNVIPEGALHARLNHLDQVNDDLTHVTTKGIPVITKEGGEVIQHAEIEHSEIIFTLDVTNKIEDLRKKWHEDKEDKYAIEAGKLLVKEILHNTDDRTNLIESVE